MKKIIIIVTLILSSCSNPTKVIFLGDSITELAIYSKGENIVNDTLIVDSEYDGFISLLKQKLDDDVELIGKGIGGDKVSDLLTRYKKDVIKLNPDIVFIYIGINDVWHKYDYGTGSDIDLYERGLRQIIDDIKSQGAKIILCTPTLIGENSGEFTLVNQFKDVETMEKMNGDLDAFSDVIRKLSMEFDTDILDLREIFMTYVSENNINNQAAGILTYDGVHLNDPGNKLIADEMLKFIN
jgi:lysophospholipase L1-like esterase